MDEQSPIAVSPRHSVRLAREYLELIQKAPRKDFVVRVITRREANGMPLMSAEIVIAGQRTREDFPLAASYPLHFRKTYFPGRLHGDPKLEFERQSEASRLGRALPPIGFADDVFRACLLPGKAYSALSPFQVDPEVGNVARARELGMAAAAGLWRLAEEAERELRALHAGSLVHGDAELHNFIVCPSPLEIVPIDFESAVRRESMSDADWQARCAADLVPLLKHAVLLECSLGFQPGPLGELAWAEIDNLFKDPERFRSEIGRKTDREVG